MPDSFLPGMPESVHVRSRTYYTGYTSRARTDNVNVHYFETWSPAMAYILGYIWADGSIVANQKKAGDPRPGRLCFGCVDTDRCILEFIKAETKSTSCISRLVFREGGNRGHTDKPQARFRISSLALVTSLVRLHGLCEDKTHKDCPFPEVPEEHFPHFARGYLDGDGCIYGSRRRPNQCKVHFLGTPAWLRVFAGRLSVATGARNPKLYDQRSSNSLCRILWGSREDALKLVAYLYPPGDNYFFLPRKREKAEKLLRIGKHAHLPVVSKPSRRARNITAFGFTMSMTDWARLMDVHPVTLYYRLTKSGLTPEEAITRPNRAGVSLDPSKITAPPAPTFRKIRRNHSASAKPSP